MQLFLVITTVIARVGAAPVGLIPLALNEIRHRYNALALTPAADNTIWSTGR